MSILNSKAKPTHTITKEQLIRAVPPKAKSSVTQEVVEDINLLLQDPVTREALKDNILGFTSVLKEGKFSLDSYINAVKFISYKLMGNSNVQSYAMTFPERYQRMLDRGYAANTITAHVAMYNKTKLVVLLTEQTLIPSYVLNQDLYQKALNVQADLMLSARSEKVRCDAANSLLNQLKLPETQKVDLNVQMREDDSIKQLRESTLELVRQQKKMIEAGAMNAKDIASSKLTIAGEYVDEGVTADS